VVASTAAPSLVVIACAAGIDLRAQQLLASLVTRLGGRGGGKSAFAQGGTDASAAEIIAAARSSIMAEPTTNS